MAKYRKRPRYKTNSAELDSAHTNTTHTNSAHPAVNASTWLGEH